MRRGSAGRSRPGPGGLCVRYPAVRLLRTSLWVRRLAVATGIRNRLVPVGRLRLEPLSLRAGALVGIHLLLRRLDPHPVWLGMGAGASPSRPLAQVGPSRSRGTRPSRRPARRRRSRPLGRAPRRRLSQARALREPDPAPAGLVAARHGAPGEDLPQLPVTGSRRRARGGAATRGRAATRVRLTRPRGPECSAATHADLPSAVGPDRGPPPGGTRARCSRGRAAAREHAAGDVVAIPWTRHLRPGTRDTDPDSERAFARLLEPAGRSRVQGRRPRSHATRRRPAARALVIARIDSPSRSSAALPLAESLASIWARAAATRALT